MSTFFTYTVIFKDVPPIEYLDDLDSFIARKLRETLRIDPKTCEPIPPNEIVLPDIKTFHLLKQGIGSEFAGYDDLGAFVWHGSIRLRPPLASDSEDGERWIWKSQK